MTRSLKVAAAQTGAVEAGMAAMVPKAVKMIENAANQGARIVTFSELFMTPFFPNRLDEDFDRYFVEKDNEDLLKIREAAREAEIALILPFAERGTSSMYNSAMVTDSRGRVVGIYRKTHIPAYFPSRAPGGTGSFEKFYFTPGHTLPVFEVDGVRIGVQICNDRLYPEGSRVLALGGAEVIFMPIAYSVYTDPEYRSAIWELAIRCRAFENGVYVVAANKVGLEGERRHLGRSMIVDPRGVVMAEASDSSDDLIVQEIDLDGVSKARKGFPWWRDRRPELYSSLSES